MAHPDHADRYRRATWPDAAQVAESRRSGQRSVLLDATPREHKPDHPCRVCGGETETEPQRRRRCVSPECAGRDSWVRRR